MDTMIKYPRTFHLRGSRLQPGDDGFGDVPFATLRGATLVVEEKIDGANAGISFGPAGELRLQSRGHFLRGGPREKQFALLKTWAQCHQHWLWDALGSRYVLYGEWLYAKHTVFYDALPHYFMEFDVLDRQSGQFLSTDLRRLMFAGMPLAAVPVLHAGPLESLDDLLALIGPSAFKTSAWRERLAAASAAAGLDPARVAAETDRSDLMEGLYIKVEADGQVLDRYKYVRADFLQAILDSGSHWLDRPILPNQLRDGVDLYGASHEPV